jgi:glycosyltransferase involved in cell wall biosynthesis
MQICQVIPHYIPAYRFGGPQRVAHSLGKALVQAGHQVVVCTTNLADEETDLNVPLDEPVDLDGITVYYEPTIMSRYWGFSPRLYRRVQQEIARADVVLVHFHYQFANWAGASIARRQRKPYILFPHGSLNRWGVARKSRLKKRLYLWLLERRNIQKALFIAFNAPEERLLSLFSEQGRVVPSGIAPADFEAMPVPGYWRSRRAHLQDKLCFLYLGRLNPSQKGLDMLIPAFARLARARKDVHLVLAGPDERGGEQQVRQLIRELGVEADVTLTGMLKGVEKLAVLQDCDVYVLSSPSEGMSIALLEALYAGLPVIVTDRVGLSGRIAREGCGLVVEADAQQLHTALRAMLDAGARAEMGRRGKALIQAEYTWDVIAENLIAQIQEALA